MWGGENLKKSVFILWMATMSIGLLAVIFNQSPNLWMLFGFLFGLLSVSSK